MGFGTHIHRCRFWGRLALHEINQIAFSGALKAVCVCPHAGQHQLHPQKLMKLFAASHNKALKTNKNRKAHNTGVAWRAVVWRVAAANGRRANTAHRARDHQASSNATGGGCCH